MAIAVEPSRVAERLGGVDVPINPAHPAYHAISASAARPVPWDPRLFGAS